jgi:hypothetical protein
MLVYHLLSTQNALSDIALKRIRLSRYSDLNDPFELLSANLREKPMRKAMREWKEDFHRTKGLLCFSKNWENPVLWSHYADKHRGVALAFEIPDAFALNIEYSEDRLPVTFKNGDPTQGLDEGFAGRLVRTKCIHWKYEEEVRLMLSLDEGTIEDGSYFFPFDDNLKLRQVILGPLCAIPINAVRSLVDSIYTGVRVRKARLAFKWFKVVPDERHEGIPIDAAGSMNEAV